MLPLSYVFRVQIDSIANRILYKRTRSIIDIIPSATTDIYSVEADRKPVREGEHSSIHWRCDGPCRSDPPDRALGRGRSGSGDSLGLARGEGASVSGGAGEFSSVASSVEHSSPSMVR